MIVRLNRSCWGRRAGFQSILERNKDYNISEIEFMKFIALMFSIYKDIWKINFQSLFEYFEEYKLLSVDQSGFQANDSCVKQLLFTVHDV